MINTLKSLVVSILVCNFSNLLAQIPEKDSVSNAEQRHMDFLSRRSTPNQNKGFSSLYAEAVKNIKDRNVTVNKTEDQWTPLGPMGDYKLTGNGRISRILLHPSDTNIWYVCVAQGGVWKTTNAGASWISISGDLPILRTSDIAVDPNDPDIMYVVTGDYIYLDHNIPANDNKRSTHYGLGIFKTTDGGSHWEPTGLSFKQTDFEETIISRLIMDPNDSKKLIAVGSTGSYITEDSAKTWTKTNSGMFVDMVIDPSNPSTLYAATGYAHNFGIGEAGIHKSSDFGRTWRKLNSGIPEQGAVRRIKVAVSASDNRYVYAIACDTNGYFYGFYQSKDSGATIIQTVDASYNYNLMSGEFDNDDGSQGWYVMTIAVDQYDPEHVLVGGVNLWQTMNGGSDFSPVTYWRLMYNNTGLHADIQYIIQRPNDSSFFVAHDGGISRTFKTYEETTQGLKDGDYKTKWTHYTNGLNITSFYRLSVNSRNTDEKFVGSQDNSTYYYNGLKFYYTTGGDGMESTFLDSEGFRYTSSQNGYLHVLDWSLTNFEYNSTLAPPFGEKGEWTTPFVGANGKVYILYGNLYKVEGTSRSQIGQKFKNMPGKNYPAPGCALAVHKYSGLKVYAAKRPYTLDGVDNEIVRSDNEGFSWTDISDGLPRDLYPTYLDMDHDNWDEVWITFGGFDSLRKVYYSNDGGETWDNITYDLPNIPVNCIVHQDDGSGLVYVGTDLGVFYLRKNSSSWTYYSESLPKVIISELELDPANGLLVAATFGRGMWEVGLVDYQKNTHVNTIHSSQYEVNLFPNPTQDILNISIESDINEEIDIKIVDIMGRTVDSRNFKSNSRSTKLHFNTSDLLSGKYFVVIQTKDERIVKTYIKI